MTTIDFSEQLRDRFPNFKDDLEQAIALTQMKQIRHYDFWVDPDSRKMLKVLVKNIDAIAWGKKCQKEKVAIFRKSVILFAETIQSLIEMNGDSEFINIEPIQKLYSELVMLLPSNDVIQLSINLWRC
ncbi:hypothetical protein [Myxosarcina sp. GI1]|uniref:hypothetical protein n=1 Tax=Myxosarcina sp. GI1 TaxID=1541065 RepID=UPI00056674B4|nr:hypothetical protein [Myxosarcina sp. GI1]